MSYIDQNTKTDTDENRYNDSLRDYHKQSLLLWWHWTIRTTE